MSLKPANRICSLLPSATEIVGRLGLADRLVCVTHECDVAPNAQTLEGMIESGQVSRVTSSAINPAVYSQVWKSRIDDMVTSSLGTGEGLYGIDNSAVAKSRPDLIITQQLCAVCAPSGTHVAAALEAVSNALQNTQLPSLLNGSRSNEAPVSAAAAPSAAPSPRVLLPPATGPPTLPPVDGAAAGVTCGTSSATSQPLQTSVAQPEAPQVLSLEPESLLDVADSCVDIAHACGELLLGRSLRTEFIGQLEAISQAVSCPNGAKVPTPERRVFILEWLDPPFDAGHWVPEIQQIALGQFHLTSCACAADDPASPTVPGEAPGNACTWTAKKSKRIDWERIAEVNPDTLIVSCCGFGYERNATDARMMLSRHPVARGLTAVQSGRIFAVDGNRYLARPGPSLAQGAAAVAASVWYDDPARMSALVTTGLVPEEGVMWGRVHVNPEEDLTLGMLGMGSGIGDMEDVPTASLRNGSRGGGSGDGGGTDMTARKTKSWAEMHKEAAGKGEKFYEDPESRLMVMTEVVHKERGACCGRACRHCPYMHDRVAMHARPELISRVAWLQAPPAKHAASGGVHVLVCGCTQDDLRQAAKLHSHGEAVVLVAPLDADSRVVEGSSMHAVDASESARTAGVPLVGVPVHIGGPQAEELFSDAVQVIRATYGPQCMGKVSVLDTLQEWAAVWRAVAVL